MKIVKNLTFTVPKPIWETKRGFILLEVDPRDRNIRALLHWNPILTKATYKIKVVNATTKEWYRHTLTKIELIDDDKYIIAFFNTHEVFDAMVDLIPTLTTVGVMASIASHFRKEPKTIKELASPK